MKWEDSKFNRKLAGSQDLTLHTMLSYGVATVGQTP